VSHITFWNAETEALLTQQLVQEFLSLSADWNKYKEKIKDKFCNKKIHPFS